MNSNENVLLHLETVRWEVWVYKTPRTSLGIKRVNARGNPFYKMPVFIYELGRVGFIYLKKKK